ncbi:MAG: hypothetical protein ABIK09_00600 [Pseudomonadota bacterium]
MKFRWTILFAMLFAFALAVGCSDEKTPPPPGQEKKADEPAAKPAPAPAEKTAEPVKDEPGPGEQPAETDPAADGTETDGTEVKSDGEVPDKLVEPPKQIERALAKTALHGGLAPLDALVGKIGSILSPSLKAMLETAVYQGLLAEIASKMKVADMDWFDRTRSLRVAVHSQESVVLLVPLLSKETLLAALPEELRTEVEGKTPLRFKLGDAFAEVVGKDLLLSDKQENIDQLDGTLKLELAKLQVEQLFSVILEGTSLAPLVSTSLEEVERNLEMVAPMDPTQKEFFAKAFNLLKDIIAEIDRVEISLDIAQQDLVLNYSVTALDGTNLHSAISGARNLPISTLKYMPLKSWFVGGQNINPSLMMPWLERYMDILASAYSMSTDEKIELWKDYKLLIGLMTGDGAYAVYTDAGFPLSMTAVSEVTDGARMADLLYGIYDYFFQKAMDTLPPESRQMFGGRTLKEMVVQIQPMVKSFGVDLKIDSEIYQDVQMDYLRISLDYTLMTLPEDMVWLKEIIKDKVDFVMAFSPTHLIFTMGPNGLVRAKEVVDGKEQLVPATLFPGIEASKYNFVMNVDLLDLEQALEAVPEFRAFVHSEMGAELEMITGHKGFFVLAGVDGAKAWLDVRLGLEKLMPLIEYTVKKQMEAPDDDAAVPPPATDPAE